MSQDDKGCIFTILALAGSGALLMLAYAAGQAICGGCLHP